MGDFLASIFGGQNKPLNQGIDATGQQAGFDTGQGQSDVTAGTDFLKSILSGDATKQMQVLAPEIGAEKRGLQSDQAYQTMTGGRTGGVAASNATTADKVHSDITGLVGNLTGTAATALPQIGTTLTAQGTAAQAEQARLAQERMQNWQNSIAGSSIKGAADYAESFLPVAHGGGGGGDDLGGGFAGEI